MANKYIGDVTTSTPALTDFLVGVNGSDVYKALVSDVAKKIIEDYSGSTISGSAQSIQSAFSGANEIISANNITGYNNRQGWIALTSGQDLNTCITPGIYQAAGDAIAASLLNTPFKYGFKMVVEILTANNSRIGQTIIPLARSWYTHRWYRNTLDGGTTWTDWVLIPLRSEVDAIANRGGKNFLGNIYKNNGQTTKNGITYTLNSDGSITLNGTATATAEYYLSVRTSPHVILPKGTYILSGCPEGGSTSTYYIGYNRGSSGTTLGRDIGAGATITENVGGQNYGVWITVANGVTVENLTFYPMIRDASVQDGTYVPYGMSNAEITTEIVDANTLYNATMESDYSSGSIRYVRFGRMVVFAGIFNMLGTETNGKVIGTGLPTALVGNSKFVGANNSGGEGPVFYLSSGGELRVMGAYTLTGSARVSGAYISYN